jgi:peptidoglycan/LPS O-acetylase OafA/YrhL
MGNNCWLLLALKRVDRILMILPSSQAPRIPSLDGIRALSIYLVLLAHLKGTAGFPIANGRSTIGDIGELGVRIFFVISGFIITKLLLQELEQSGAISLRRFYLRRTLRIFPASYCYLAVIGLISAFGFLSVTGSDLRNGAVYLMNYAKTRSWSVGHMWSLSVEEQFYLLWPAVVCAFGRIRAMQAAALLVVLAPVSRVVIWYAFPDLRFGIGEFFVSSRDSKTS